MEAHHRSLTCRQAPDGLLEVLTGRTPPDVRRTVEAHLVDCAACRAEADVLAETVAALRQAPEPQPPPGFWPGFMAALEARARRQPRSWGQRARQWLATPPRLAGTVATAALVIGLIAALVPPPAGQPLSEPAVQVAPYVSDAVRALLPSLRETVELWKAGLAGAEGEPLLDPLIPP